MKAGILLIAWSLVLNQHVSAMSEPVSHCTPEETRHDVPDGKCEVTYACGNPPGLCEATYACHNSHGVVHVPIPGSKQTHTLGCSYASVTYWHDGKIKKQCCGSSGIRKDPNHHRDNRVPDPHKETGPHKDPHHLGDIREPHPYQDYPNHQKPIGSEPPTGKRTETTLVIKSETGPGRTQNTEPTHKPEIHQPYDDQEFEYPHIRQPWIRHPDDANPTHEDPENEYPHIRNPWPKRPNHENPVIEEPPHIKEPWNWNRHPDGEKRGCENCKKDKNSAVKIDEKDNTHVWACRCNEGEKPQLLPLVGTTIPSTCADQHGAVTILNGKKVLYRCNMEFHSAGKWKKITATTAHDCAEKCTSGVEGKCLAASFWLPNHECYLATDKFTWHSKPNWLSMQFVEDDHVNCADIHGATKVIGGKNFRFTCNEDFWANHQWKNITATDITDCAQKCVGGKEGICLGASFDLNIKACYLAHVEPSWGHPKPGVVSLRLIGVDDAAKKAAEEAAKKKHDADEAAKKKQHDADEAAKKKKHDEEAARKKHDEEAARKKKHDEEAARKKKHDEEAARKKKHDEEAARKKKREADQAARKRTSHGTVCPGVTGTRMMNGKEYHIACGLLTQAVNGDYPNYYHGTYCPDAIECLRRIHALGAKRGYFDGTPGYHTCTIPKPEIENHQWRIFSNPGTVLITTYPI